MGARWRRHPCCIRTIELQIRARGGADVSHNVVDNIDSVILASMIGSFPVRAKVFIIGVLSFFCWVSSQWHLELVLKVARCVEIVFCNPPCRIRSVASFTPITFGGTCVQGNKL